MTGDFEKRSRSSCEGLTLIELTIAVALFTVILVSAAQALVSYRVALDVQNQRVMAINSCRAILSDMRDLRDANTNTFPAAITSIYPEGSAVPNPGGIVTTLPQGQVTVTYVDADANPLQVTVTCTWRDLRNRPQQAAITSILTNV